MFLYKSPFSDPILKCLRDEYILYLLKNWWAPRSRGVGVFIYLSCFITGHLPSKIKAAARAGGGDSWLEGREFTSLNAASTAAAKGLRLQRPDWSAHTVGGGCGEAQIAQTKRFTKLGRDLILHQKTEKIQCNRTSSNLNQASKHRIVHLYFGVTTLRPLYGVAWKISAKVEEKEDLLWI